MKDKNNLIAILYASIGYGIFTVFDALIKMLVTTYPTFYIIFIETSLGLIFITLYGLYFYGRKFYLTKNRLMHALRAFSTVMLVWLNITAFKTLQLDEFYAIIFTAPFLIIIFSYILLKERIHKKQVYALIAGFSCILYMLRPGQELFQIGAVFALLSAMFYALSTICVRVMGGKEPTILLPFYTNMALVCIALPITFLQEGTILIPNNTHDALLFLAIGIIGSIGTPILAMGIHRATTTAVIAPFHYTQMIWGIALGYFLFNDLPNIVTLTGATGLIITGIYLLHHETRQLKTVIDKLGS